MRIVLEAGAWILAEDDDDPEVRLWHNRASGETRTDDDVPNEVSEFLANQGNVQRPQPTEAPQAKSVPFQRQRGVAGGAAAVGPLLPSAVAGAVAAVAAGPQAPAVRQSGYEVGASGAAGGSSVGRGNGTLCRLPERGMDTLRGGGGDYAVVEPAWLQDDLHANPGTDAQMRSCDATIEALPQGDSHDHDVDDEFEAAPPSPPADLPQRPVRKLTPAILARATTQRARHGETPEQLLQRVTHLHLDGKHLTVLGDALHIACSTNCLRVLYLSNNALHEMGPLRPSIEALHLGSNHLWEMGSWSRNLPALQVLDLRENSLELVEGLDKSHSLRELILRGQRPRISTAGHACSLRFSARTLRNIAPALRLLNVSQCALRDLCPLRCLGSLENLDAGENELAEVGSTVAPALRSMPRLRSLRLEGNPFSMRKGRQRSEYRHDVILLTPRLQELDGKGVLRSEHVFLTELGERRQRRLSREGSRDGSKTASGMVATAEVAPPEDPSLGQGQHRRASRSGTGDSSSRMEYQRSASEGLHMSRRSPAAAPLQGKSSGSSEASRLPPLPPGSGGSSSVHGAGSREATMLRPRRQRSHDAFL